MKTILIIPLLVLTGCVVVPKTIINGQINGQPFSISSPKDSTITGLLIIASSNSVSVKIESLSTRMNPDVITTTGDAQIKMIQAISTATAQAVGAGVSAAK